MSVPVQLANWPGIPETEAQWQDNFKDRLIISGFMKDGTLGDRTATAQSQHSHSTVTAQAQHTVTAHGYSTVMKDGTLGP